MNSILIKIGKAWQVIKRDGPIKGSGRVVGAFFSQFSRVGSGDILFISGGVGDSALYRTKHVAEELSSNGFKCSTTIQDNPFLLKYVDKFSIFVFHRTMYTGQIQNVIQKIKDSKKTIIFDTDDLTYDPKFVKHMDYFKNIHSLERKLYENGLGGEILRDPYVQVATTTTSYLADRLREEGKNVFIVSNKSSVEDVKHADEAYANRKEYRSKIRIGYFSGTISHNKDFATITSALMHILEKYRNVELLLVGPLDVEHELVQMFKDRIVQLPYAPRKQHFINLVKCDINLAPLELDNPFCESKSELKYFEAGLVRVPTIAVSTRTFQEAIQDGVNGFIAGSESEWIEKLSKLIESKELRTNMGSKAYTEVMRLHVTSNAKNEEYIKYLLSKKPSS